MEPGTVNNTVDATIRMTPSKGSRGDFRPFCGVSIGLLSRQGGILIQCQKNKTSVLREMNN